MSKNIFKQIPKINIHIKSVLFIYRVHSFTPHSALRTPHFLLLLLTSLLLVSCSSDWFSSFSSRKERVLRIAMTNMPTSFDALTTTDYYTNMVSDNIFEALVRSDMYGKMESVIAEYWYSPDDSTTVLKIKDDIYFSDGSRMTINDVIASIKRADTHPTTRERTERNVIKSIDIDVENRLLYLHYAPTSRNVMIMLHSAFIYKATYLENFTDEQLMWNPMATGEYYLYSFEKRDEDSPVQKIVLKRNIYHRDYSLHKKAPDIVEIIYEKSIERQYQMLKDGEIDFMLGLDHYDYADALAQPDIEVYDKLGPTIMSLCLDGSNDYNTEITLPASSSVRNNPLKDKRVRKAIAHSLDMRTYISDVLLGKAHLLSLPTSRSTIGYDINKEYYAFDTDLAKSLMAEVGFADGFEMKLRISDGRYSQNLSKFIQESLKEINIDVKIDMYPAPEFYRSIGIVRPAAIIVGYSQMYANNSLDIRMNLYFNKNEKVSSTRFYINYPPIIEYLATIRTQPLSSPSRQTMTRELADMIYDEVFVVPLFQLYDFYVLRKHIKWDLATRIKYSDFQVKL